MATLADLSCDVVITDPPYDSHTHNAVRVGTTRAERRSGKSYNRATSLGFDPLTQDEMQAAAAQCARLARRWVLVFCSLEMVSAWKGELELTGLEYVRCGIWVKEGATPQFTGDRPASGAEAIVIAHRPGRKHWNGGGRHAVWSAPILIGSRNLETRFHTTQKPRALIDALVRDFSEPGELVLDPFTGSGTTGESCIALGRRFIGWELNPEMAEKARARLANARQQLSLEVTCPTKMQQTTLSLPGDSASS